MAFIPKTNGLNRNTGLPACCTLFLSKASIDFIGINRNSSEALSSCFYFRLIYQAVIHRFSRSRHINVIIRFFPFDIQVAAL